MRSVDVQLLKFNGPWVYFKIQGSKIDFVSKKQKLRFYNETVFLWAAQKHLKLKLMNK